MGTSSLVRIYDRMELLVTLFIATKSHPDLLGMQMKRFIKSRPFMPSLLNNRPLFNNPGCFAAQFVKNFKEESGGLYIYPADTEEKVSFHYHIYLRSEKGRVRTVEFVCEEDFRADECFKV